MLNEPDNRLAEARNSLHLGIKLSKQAAFARRAPEPVSLPHFGRANEILRGVLISDPANRDALLMMSQVSESLLDYDAAIDFASRAFKAGEPKTKKALKRLALLGANSRFWQRLLLSPTALRELGEYLEAAHVGPENGTMELTRQWLESKGFEEPSHVIESLEKVGAFSDFQVLVNLARG